MFSRGRIATFIALTAAVTFGYARAADSQPQAAITSDAPPPVRPPVTGKWDTSIYGFIELDTIHDSTESFTEIAGNGLVARPSTYAGDHGETQFTPRNTRLGFRFASPEYNGAKVTGLLETDFFGTQPAKSGDASQSGYYSSPLLRIRHAYFVIKTAPVDVLFGQTWQLFGWQSYFQPATVDLQGVPGELYSRQPQIRLSHAFKTDPLTVDVALATARGQSDSEVPDGEGGVRFLMNDWKGLKTTGGTGTAVDAAGLGVSGIARKFRVPTGTDSSTSADGWGYSFDLLLPVIPATMDRRDNGLTILANFQRSAGATDYYTGFNGGIGALPSGTTNVATTAGALDSGIAVLNKGVLDPIRWRTFFLNVQYHLPVLPLWVSANFSQTYGESMKDLLASKTPGIGAGQINRANWVEGSLFWDVTPAARLGVEYARFMQTYLAALNATNHNLFAADNRFQLSGWYVF